MINLFLFISKFYLFFFFLYFFGRAFIIMNSKILKINSSSEIQGIDVQIFYPVLGVFFLGNLLFFINFFIPVNSYFSYLLLFFLLFNLREPVDLQIFKNIYFNLLIFPILLVSSFDINFHYDAGLYHLNNQLWIRESNIILGFSNIYGPFGVSSIYEYISAFLWIDKSFILIHFLNLIFIGFLFTFLFCSLTKSQKSGLFTGSLCVVLFGVLDNVGFGGGRNGFISIQSIGKQDTAIAVMFLVTSILLIYSIINDSFKEEEIIFYSIFSLFTFQLKVSGISIVFIFFLYIFLYSKKLNKNIFYILKEINYLFFIFFLWLFKSILHTGCWIFPLESSCYSRLSWVDSKYIQNIENVTVNFSNSYYFGDSFQLWVNKYLELPLNSIVFRNFALSAFVIFALLVLFFEKNSEEINNKYLFAIIFLCLLFYIRFGPDVRYLSGLMMYIIFLLGISYKPKKNVPKILIYGLILTCITMVPNLASYKSLSFQAPLAVLLPEEPMKNLYNRLIPVSGDQCWVNINCSANLENYSINNTGYFKIVTIDN